MSRLRAFGRWLTDWRTGATLVASILVALLAIVVVDAIQSRRAADARADRTIGELGELRRRGERIDALAAQLEDASNARAQLAEEVRALREMLIDAGMLEPRPQQTGNSTPTRPESTRRPTTGPESTPRPRPSPRPSASPSPSPSPSPCVLRDPLTGACLILPPPAPSPPPRPRAYSGR